MRSIFDDLSPAETIRSVLSETQEAVENVQQMSGFLVDPSSGFLTQHQRDVAYKIYQGAEQLSYILGELQKYHQNMAKDEGASAPSPASDSNNS